MAIILIIDGENFKGKIKAVFYEAKKERPIWHQYDFKGLFDKVLKDISVTRKVFYFARVKEHPDSKEKSLELIEEQRLLKTHLEKNGFEVMLSGRVRGQMERVGSKTALVFKEKGVDVKIAVDMVAAACDKIADEIILCSSDSDLQPAIKETIQRDVKCVYLGFESQPNKGIAYTTDRTILIRNSEVMEFEKGKMDYKGIIIEESLEDKAILKDVKIISKKVDAVIEKDKHQTPWVKQWTKYFIEIPDARAAAVAEKLSRAIDRNHISAWYADYMTDTEHYIIFRDKTFHITNRTDHTQYDEAIKYGITLGIPRDQIDVPSWRK